MFILFSSEVMIDDFSPFTFFFQKHKFLFGICGFCLDFATVTDFFVLFGHNGERDFFFSF